LIAPSSCQAKVLNRDGHEQLILIFYFFTLIFILILSTS